MKYRVISEYWGDPVEVTFADIRRQAMIFGCNGELLEERRDGVYFDGEKIAKADR